MFLDRDGVLNEERSFLSREEDLSVPTGTREALASLRRHDFLRLVVSNQSGLARSLFDFDTLAQLHKKLWNEVGGELDAFYVCPHHPEAEREELRVDCSCRKPRPALLLQGIAEWDLVRNDCWLVGDAPRDIEAAKILGIRAILVTGPKIQAANDYPSQATTPDSFASSLTGAVRFILAEEARSVSETDT